MIAVALGAILLLGGDDDVIDPPGITEGPGQNTDPGTNPGITGKTYVNDGIGISFTLAKGWEVRESSGYPDLMLDVSCDADSKTYIWIDRWPGESLKDFYADKTGYLEAYSSGSSAVKITVVSETEVKQGGLTWQRIDFEVKDPGDDHYVSLFITDMPNNRGLFMFAVVTPLKQIGQTSSPYYQEGLKMFESLKFTK